MNANAKTDRLATSPFRRFMFGGLATFILLAPAMPQVFGYGNPIFRPWKMYSIVGMGLLRGEFTINRNGSDEVLTPSEFLNLLRYKLAMRLTQPYLVFGENDLRARIEEYCARNRVDASISFKGEVALVREWKALSLAMRCKE